MESEKVKEIKKALECCSVRSGKCDQCLFIKEGFDCDLYLLMDALKLINELESENERLKKVVDIANERTYRKKFIDEWRKEYQKELDKQGNGHIAGYPDFDLVYKLYFEQKKRIAELEKEKTEQLKQFAVRLIDKKLRCGERFNIYDIDETLKEFIYE